jgi:disulfide bond formation protein DsbB
MRAFFSRFGLYFAWLISLVATFSSFYASEILNYKPCIFCWYQRMMMFPLVIILGVAAYKRNKEVISYVIALPLIGAFIAFVQSISSYFHITSFFCKMECMEESIKLFGFVDFSVASFLAFMMIFFLLVNARKRI